MWCDFTYIHIKLYIYITNTVFQHQQFFNTSILYLNSNTKFLQLYLVWSHKLRAQFYKMTPTSDSWKWEVLDPSLLPLLSDSVNIWSLLTLSFWLDDFLESTKIHHNDQVPGMPQGRDWGWGARAGRSRDLVLGTCLLFSAEAASPHGFQIRLSPHLLDRIVRPAGPRGFNSSSNFPPLRCWTSTKHDGPILWLVFLNSNPALPIITKARQSPRASAALVQQLGQRLNVLCKFVAQQNGQYLYVECEAGSGTAKKRKAWGCATQKGDQEIKTFLKIRWIKYLGDSREEWLIAGESMCSGFSQ